MIRFLLLCLFLVVSISHNVTATEAISYRLYPGDLLRVSVYDHADLTIDIRIPPNGRVSFPLIGDINSVVGMTEDSFSATIKQRLEDGYIRQAVLTLTLLEYGPRRAYVMGSVFRPDFIDLNPLAPTSAMQAIGQVGGFNEDANRSAIQIIRDMRDGSGRKTSVPVSANRTEDVLKGDVILQAGDIVVVPRLDRVYIIGRVAKPGAINLPSQEQLTVSKAVSLAGGFDRFAQKDAVQLLRVGEPIREVPVQSILDGDSEVEDPILRPGDTISIPESRF